MLKNKSKFIDILTYQIFNISIEQKTNFLTSMNRYYRFDQCVFEKIFQQVVDHRWTARMEYSFSVSSENTIK